MKSRTSLSPSHRAAAFAGLLVLTSLALPSAVRAQTIEGARALLNTTDAPFGVSRKTITPAIDGERALLNRPSVSAPPVFQPAGSRSTLEGAYRIDGQCALLGQSCGPKTTHATLAVRN
jgi:hypothetical protein